eukprot:1159228-Pelagomonas_calceolata.AAC.3
MEADHNECAARHAHEYARQQYSGFDLLSCLLPLQASIAHKQHAYPLEGQGPFCCLAELLGRRNHTKQPFALHREHTSSVSTGRRLKQYHTSTGIDATATPTLLSGRLCASWSARVGGTMTSCRPVRMNTGSSRASLTHVLRSLFWLLLRRRVVSISASHQPSTGALYSSTTWAQEQVRRQSSKQGQCWEFASQQCWHRDWALPSTGALYSSTTWGTRNN